MLESRDLHASRLVLALAASIACCACAGPRTGRAPARAAASPGASAGDLDYTFTLDAELSTLQARVCFEHEPPDSLVYGTLQAVDLIHDAFAEQGATRRPLPSGQGRVLLQGVSAGGCIGYSVDLVAARDRDSLLLAYPVDGALVAGTDLFLWRPARRVPGFRARARFVAPPGIDAAVPWMREPAGDYVIDETSFAFMGHAAFGKLEREHITAPGAQLELIVLPGFPAATRALLVPWLQTAANAVARATGRLPSPFIQIVLAPSAASPRPIHFGHTARAGAPSILIFVPTDTSRDDVRADWIAIHELSHLLLPFVKRDDAWLSEGFATYMQEVLRVRAGLQAPEVAWKRLYDGAKLGLEARGSLADETRAMGHSNNYARVYWAGAAILLLADVALREQSQGALSLDRVVAGLGPRVDDTDRPCSAAELLDWMDSVAGSRTLHEVSQRYLSAPTLPQLDDLFARLGVAPDGRSLEGAPLAWVRDAIMLNRPEP